MEDLEALHQKASGYYLQGDLNAALETWRQLLTIQPQDERAQEGVRLCEQQMGGTQESVCSPGESPFAVGPAPGGAHAATPDVPDPTAQPAPAAPAAPNLDAEGFEGLDDDLDALDLKLDFFEPDGTAVAPQPVAPPEPPAAAPAPPSNAGAEQAHDDAGDGWQWESNAAREPETAGSRPDHLPGMDGPPPEPVEVPDAAAVELRRRVNELLASALVAMEKERKDEALGILSRLLILDEDNEAAHRLQEKIRRDQQGDDRPHDAAVLAGEPAGPDAAGSEPIGSDVFGSDVFGSDPIATEAAASDGADADKWEGQDLNLGGSDEIGLPDRPAGGAGADTDFDADEDVGAGALDDMGAEEFEATDAALVEQTETTKPAREPIRRSALALWAGLTVVLLAAVGFWGWQLYGGGEIKRPDTDPAKEAAAAVEAALTPVIGLPDEALPVAGPQDDAVPDVSIEDEVAAAVTQAQSAMSTGDYAAAVIAYNRVLDLQPDHPQVRQALTVAGDRYREQRALEEKWESAFAQFNQGSYKAALRLFYRLPDGNRPEQVRRYKVNGWYNLGVEALQTGDCTTATDTLKDAREVQPDDSGVLHALGLAQSCKRGHWSSVRVAVEALRVRGLDD